MSDVSAFWGNSPTVPSPANIQNTGNNQYAGLLIRILAFYADMAVFFACFLAAAFFLQFSLPDVIKSLSAETGGIITSLGLMGYFTVFTAINGATPGKKLFKLEVQRGNSARLTFPRVLIRETIGRLIADLFLFSYLIVLFNRRRKGVHDYIADTVVIRKSIPWKYESLLLLLLLGGLLLLPVLSIGMLAAVDPFEQMKKSADVTSRNTAAELHNAIIRYQITNNRFPWNTAINAVQLSDGEMTGSTGYLRQLINAGELKSDFVKITGAGNPEKIFVSSGSTPGDVAICFKPESRSFSRDPETKYRNDGTVNPDCPTWSRECYWCYR